MKKKTSTSKKALNKKVAKGKKSPVKGGVTEEPVPAIPIN